MESVLATLKLSARCNLTWKKYAYIYVLYKKKCNNFNHIGNIVFG